MSRIYKRGPVTRINSIFHENGSVSCPFSTNSLTEDEYFTIDTADFDKVVGRSWYVHNNRQPDIRTSYKPELDPPRESDCTLLHQLLFREDTVDVALQTDHVLHWTDNRRSSVEFVTPAENKRRGPALYHKTKSTKIRRTKQVA